jgi:hypothetical protein
LYVSSSALPRSGAMERPERRPFERVGKQPLQPRVEVPPELEAPSDDVLPEPGLALVDAGRGARTERRIGEARIDGEVVERVPGLVDRDEQGARRIVRPTPGGDPHVPGREPGLERVGGEIQAAAPEVVPERLDHLRGEPELRGLGVGRPQEAVVGRLGVQDRLDERHELGPQPGEELPVRRRGDAVVALGDVWIGRVRAVRKELRVPAAQLERLLEVGNHRPEVVRRPGPRPREVRGGRVRRPFCHERVGDAPRALVLASRDADEGRVVVVLATLRLERRELVQEDGDPIVDQPEVRRAAEERELEGPALGSALRHLDRPVPLEDRRDAPQQVHLVDPSSKLREGLARARGVHGGLSRPPRPR